MQRIFGEISSSVLLELFRLFKLSTRLLLSERLVVLTEVLHWHVLFVSVVLSLPFNVTSGDEIHFFDGLGFFRVDDLVWGEVAVIVEDGLLGLLKHFFFKLPVLLFQRGVCILEALDELVLCLQYHR